jgi:FkbH-like protein
MLLLPWLPVHDDPANALKALRSLPGPSERLGAIVQLAGYQRDFLATAKIDRQLEGCLAELGDEGMLASGLTPMRLAILPSHSVEHLLPAIRVAGLNRRLAMDVRLGGYGLHRQALLHGDHELEAFSPRLILLALDASALLPRLPIQATAARVDAAIAATVDELRLLWRQARDRYGAQPIQQLLLPLAPPLFGSFDALLPASPAALLNRLNLEIATAAREDGALVVDLARQLPEQSGGQERHDAVRWHQAKQLINPPFAPLYGDLVARLAAAVAGLSRKCLVLDLDNTLWGGVIGDDGLENIRLGQGSAEGEAYSAFQHYAAQLGARGIILAVCSKNDDVVARAAFQQHPDMALRMPDIACFMANWTDKPANLRAIARRLNIGSDSLVFVDDNPAERAIVRRELPEVAVPELPDDVSGYPARLAAAGYFEAASFTTEDLDRGRAYATNAKRQEVLDTATDMDGFLQSLEMTLVARPIGPLERPRAAQLINKSNQYNLTTRRRTEQELEAVLTDPGALAFGFRLIDRFGDNGLISVVLARPDSDLPANELLIDTWLMSCRVLGRGVEAAALACLIEAARSRGCSALIGEFRPSGRNGMVEDHYTRLGFTPDDQPGGMDLSSRYWRLPLAEAAVPTHHIKLEVAA